MRIIYPVLLLLPCFLVAQQQELRAIVSDSNTPPYAIFDANAALQAGLSKDIIDELGRQLNRPVTYFNLPRTRVEQWLIDGKADVACFLNPDWVTKPEKIGWTDALFTTQQLLIRRPDTEPITGIQFLAGKRVGTTWGFSYPELEPLFRLRDAVRDDAHTLESNLLRLKQDRLDVVMTVDLSYLFYVKTTGDDSLAADPLWSDPAGVYCAVSLHNPADAAEFTQQFIRLVQSGFVQQQLKFYMGRHIPL